MAKLWQSDTSGHPGHRLIAAETPARARRANGDFIRVNCDGGCFTNDPSSYTSCRG